MKTKILALILLVVSGVARADLTAIVTPGYQFPLDGSVVPSYSLLNLLGQPTITIYGTIGGSNTLAVGSVTGSQLSSSVADGLSIGFNANNPPSLQVLSSGLAGYGLTNSGTSQLSVIVNPALTFQMVTNSLGQTNYFLTINTNWTYAQVWTPWSIYSLPTNYSNAWGYTNLAPVTNLYVFSNSAPTLTGNDRLPVLASQQGTNPTVTTVTALGQAIAAQNLRKIANLTFYATNNFVTNTVTFTGASVFDVLGTNTLIDPLLGFSVTNVSVPVLLTNFCNAVNQSQALFRATVYDTNSVNLYEPVSAYPFNSCQVNVYYQVQTNNLTIVAPAYTPTRMDVPAGLLLNYNGSTLALSNLSYTWPNTNSYAFTNNIWSQWDYTGGISCALTNLPEGFMTFTNFGKYNEFGTLTFKVNPANHGNFNGTWTIIGGATNVWGQVGTWTNTLKIF